MSDTETKPEKAWTGYEIMEARELLEREAALRLGYVIMAFTRLERDICLLLAWSDEGRNLQEHAKRLTYLAFADQMKWLKRAAEKKYLTDPFALGRYQDWMARAEGVREERNRLMHGRWAVEPTSDSVVNVLGAPVGQDQVVTSYTIEDLDAVLHSIKSLSDGLHVLRDEIPVGL